MGLGQSIQNALGGLRAVQTGIELTSRNVANANTPGYTKKALELSNQVLDNRGFGVLIGDVTRQVDRYLQGQIHGEYADFNKLTVQTQFLQYIDTLFGKPGSDGSLDTIVNNVSTALIDFANAPTQNVTRQQLVENADYLATHLRDMSAQIKEMRQSTEKMIAHEVDVANNALQNISRINYQLATHGAGEGNADLKDQLDNHIDDLAAIFDIKTIEASNGTVRVFTKNGMLLADVNANRLDFDERANIGPENLYSLDSATREVGTITIVSTNGSRIDLIQQNATTTGKISGLLKMRDEILVNAQDQLDELAHGLAMAFSTSKVDSTSVTIAAGDGFDLDYSGLQNGNIIEFDYTDNVTGLAHKISFVNITDPALLPLENNVTANATDQVFGIDFSGGIGAVDVQISAALAGLGFNVALSGPTTLQIVDDGVANLVDVNGLTAYQTVSGTQGEGTAINFFTDFGGSGEINYTNSLENDGQKRGFASRIRVNAALINDNTLLIKYDPSTPLGDQTRPEDLLKRFTETSFTFNANSGIGTKSSPFVGSLDAFTRQVVADQTSNIGRHISMRDSQELVLGALNSRMEAKTKVNVDEEMANLLVLQTAYAANARIVSVVKELMDMLMRM